MNGLFLLKILADGEDDGGGARKGLNFQDFQQGLRSFNSPDPVDHSHPWLIFGAVLVVVVTAILLQQRYKRRKTEALNDLNKLTRELLREVRLPVGTGLLLKWVSAASGIPSAVLLISPSSFDRGLKTWQEHARFAPARAWCLPRLQNVRQSVFGG